jgi:hypothetical protein
MGSWNKTCGLTQIPIFHGDETVLFFLVQDPFSDSSMPSYSTSYWAPVPMPFYGTYDDYGFQDMHEGETAKLAQIKAAYGELVVINKPQGQFVDTWEVNDTVFDTWEKLQEAIHRDRLKISLFPDQKDSVVSFIMFDRKVYDKMVGDLTKKIIPVVDDFCKWAKDKAGDPLTSRGIFFRQALPEDYMEEKKIQWYDNPAAGALTFWAGRNMGSEAGWGGKPFLRNYFSSFLNRKIEQLDIKAMAEAFAIFITFDRLRKQWVPQAGEGSQDGIHPEHKIFLDAFKERLDAIKTEYEDDGEE